MGGGGGGGDCVGFRIEKWIICDAINSKTTIRFPAKLVLCGSSGLFALEDVTTTGEKRPPSASGSSSSDNEESRRLKHMSP